VEFLLAGREGLGVRFVAQEPEAARLLGGLEGVKGWDMDVVVGNVHSIVVMINVVMKRGGGGWD